MNKTVNDLFVTTRDFMGYRFLPYQSNSNNCQVFIDSVLSANGLNTPNLKEFVKQDTRSIFKNNPILENSRDTKVAPCAVIAMKPKMKSKALS